VNDDAIGVLPLKIIVPITEWKDHYSIAPWMVQLQPETSNGLDKISAADTFQMRSLSQKRFVRKLGELSEENMEQISRALSLVLAIDNP